MLAYRVAVLFSFLLVLHEAVVLLVADDLLVHNFDGFPAPRQRLAQLVDCGNDLLELEVMTVVLLQHATLGTDVGVLVAFVVGADECDGVADMLATLYLYPVNVGSFEHG